AGGIRETPVFADSAVNPFGTAFGSFDRQLLESVRFEVLTVGFELLGFLADSGSVCAEEEGQVIALSVRCGQDVVAQAEAVFPRLAVEMEGVARLRGSGIE